MANSVNKVTLLGNLGTDPEVRLSQDGNKIVSFSIATSDYWKDKTTGERKDKTEWHRVVIFSNGLAEVAEKYLKKGNKVYVEGQLRTRKWQDNSGQDKYTTEVVISNYSGSLVLTERAEAGSSSSTNEYSTPETTGNTDTSIDDEIPF